MSENHRKAIEKVLGNQRDQFQEEVEEDIEDLDVANLDDNFKKDSQYQELIASLPSHGQTVRKTKGIENLPKYTGKKITREQLNNQQADEEEDVEKDSDIDQEDLMISSDDDEEEENDKSAEEQEDGESDEQIEESNEGSDNEDNQNESEEEMNDEDEEFRQLKKVTKKIADQKKNKTYLQDKMQVDQIIDELDQEDNQDAPEQRKQRDDEAQKAKSVRQQIQIWKELVFSRFGLQKSLEAMKKFPGPADLEGFLKDESRGSVKHFEVGLLRNIDLLSRVGENLHAKCVNEKSKNIQRSSELIKQLQREVQGKKIKKLDFEKRNQLNIQLAWERQEEAFTSRHAWMEDSILRWSEKTQLLNSLNLKRSGMGALMHTPVGQTTKAMQNFETLSFKSQLKRGSFRILGRDVENLKADTDEQIYDDSDLYHELLKEYMAEVEQNNAAEQDGMLLDSTRLYLLERKLKQQEKAISQVDRKASKSRKIRFDVHQKLVNFMNPKENKEILEGRNEIVKCLWGGHSQPATADVEITEDKETGETPIIKKRKREQKEDTETPAEEGFALI